ncbi:MAG: hypoxanthine phosphoribosyltransferase [Candidatus Riflebacteria bacterium]|nr:hypoxanthine phosphoribosyltransferase [Candidatus Riflebacteria bacterium]
MTRSKPQAPEAAPHPDIEKIVISARELTAGCRRLGKEINAAYAGRKLMVVVILKGAYMFVADLVRQLEVPVEVDFMAVSSYGDSTRSSGTVRIVKDLQKDVMGREVLLVEDIVDTGLTLSYLRSLLLARHPRSLATCSLLDKRICRQVEVPVEFVGFEVPDEFLVGYGLDYQQYYRNLPFIGVLKPEIYRGESE